MIKPKFKTKSPNFSSGPTKKPDSWAFNKLDKSLLSRYHRSNFISAYMDEIFLELKDILNIPSDYKILLSPGSCSGAMQAVIWSLLGKKKITSIVYDFWGEKWSNEIKKLNYEQEVRTLLDGRMPKLDEICSSNDIFFVWTGTSTGMSIENTSWIPNNQKGIVVSDITSSVFINEIKWKKLDASVFSWQKAIGSESQHGIIVLSPKALDRLKDNSEKIVPDIIDLKNNAEKIINTPSLLCFSDFSYCLSWYKKMGGLSWANKQSRENKLVLEKWAENNIYIKNFVIDSKYRALSVSYFRFKGEISKNKLEKIFSFLEYENIAYDIRSYRKAPVGIRIWTGPTILKKDLNTLTNWLDWCFYKYI
ncbi:hypothetical protein OA848_02770 [Rickettsiales bacterium]|nr:hypothetical protein [Rickettsiales bacterium]